jgi:hypothetical protein
VIETRDLPNHNSRVIRERKRQAQGLPGYIGMMTTQPRCRVVAVLMAVVAAPLLVDGFKHNGTSSTGDFLDKWAVKVKGGKEVADAVAEQHGFRNIGQVTPSPPSLPPLSQGGGAPTARGQPWPVLLLCGHLLGSFGHAEFVRFCGGLSRSTNSSLLQCPPPPPPNNTSYPPESIPPHTELLARTTDWFAQGPLSFRAQVQR